MYSAEKRIIEWLKERKYALFIGIISLIGLFIRFENKYFESEDYDIELSADLDEDTYSLKIRKKVEE